MGALFATRHPVVGICGSNADSASVRAMMTQIAGTGAIPLFLGNHAQRRAAADLQKIDALVVMGNNSDIDPALYGQQPGPHTTVETVTPAGAARAQYETELMGLALKAKMPLVGICGGMQRLNVMLGGDLHQHVPDLTGNEDHDQSKHNIAPFIPVEPVHFVKGSTLSHIGDTIALVFAPWHRHYTYNENSMHHQAVNHVGNGLRAAAHAEDRMPDGGQLVEAIEADPNGPYGHQFLLGVQWHPEFAASAFGPKLATRITEEAGKFAQATDRTHPPALIARENILSNLDAIKPDHARTVAGGMTDMILQQRAAMTQRLQMGG